MTERPLPLNGPMVRATLSGIKTHTRRPVKEKYQSLPNIEKLVINGVEIFRGDASAVRGPLVEKLFSCPYGQPGDTLWVREEWQTTRSLDDTAPRNLIPGAPIQYVADQWNPGFGLPDAGKKRPPMFMPRWAARIFLRVKSVRVEHIKDIIGNEDALKAEGMEAVISIGKRYVGDLPLIYRFVGIMDAIYGEGFFESNPWVWNTEFERVEGHK